MPAPVAGGCQKRRKFSEVGRSPCKNIARTWPVRANGNLAWRATCVRCMSLVWCEVVGSRRKHIYLRGWIAEKNDEGVLPGVNSWSRGRE